MDHPDYLAGNYTTKFMRRLFVNGKPQPVENNEYGIKSKFIFKSGVKLLAEPTVYSAFFVKGLID